MAEITSSDWVDITTLLEKTAGEAYSIQNISTGELLLKESSTKPNITDNNGPILFTPRYKSNSIFNVESARGRIWGKLVDVTRPAILAAGEFVKDKRWAYNFDGVDDRGVLATRAINPDGDNTFEFWSPASLNGVAKVIIAQNVTGTAEFILQVSTSNILQLNFGNAFTNLLTVAQGFKSSARYGLVLTGTTAQVFEGGLEGSLINSVSFVRGAVREPSAPTIIGARQSGVSNFVNFFNGLQYDVKINGTLWPMADRNQSVQPSVPAGNNMTLFNTNPDRWQEIDL